MLFLHSDDIIRSLEQNGWLLHKSAISLDLMKSSEVRRAGDSSNNRAINRVPMILLVCDNVIGSR